MNNNDYDKGAKNAPEKNNFQQKFSTKVAREIREKVFRFGNENWQSWRAKERIKNSKQHKIIQFVIDTQFQAFKLLSNVIDFTLVGSFKLVLEAQKGTTWIGDSLDFRDRVIYRFAGVTGIVKYAPIFYALLHKGDDDIIFRSVITTQGINRSLVAYTKKEYISEIYNTLADKHGGPGKRLKNILR